MAWQDRPYNREDRAYGGGVRFSFPPFTPLTLAVMGACLVVFIIQVSTGGTAGRSPLLDYGDLTFRHGLALTQPWRWITYQYLHGGGMHLFFNMLALYFFLPPLERRWGWRGTLGFYTLGGVVAGGVYGLMALLGTFPGGLIGASGSVLAVLGACAYLFPEQRVLFFFFPVPIRVLTGLLAVIYLLTVFGDRNLADAAHLGGLAFGFFAPWLAGPALTHFIHSRRLKRTRKVVEAERRIEADVDRILQKVHDSGMNSLTRGERHTLKVATEHQRHAESTPTRRRVPK